MVHSLLIHLLRPHLKAFLKKNTPFPQRSVPTREKQAPCGGLTSEPTLSLPKGRTEKKNSQFSFISTTALSIFKELFILYP